MDTSKCCVFCSVTDQEPKRSQALSRAFNTFRVVLASQPDSVLGKLGLAAANLASRQYLTALRLYANVLYICPNGPPELRLALGTIITINYSSSELLTILSVLI